MYHDGTVNTEIQPLYTVKLTPCGHKGRYVRITDDYLRSAKDPITTPKSANGKNLNKASSAVRKAEPVESKA